MSTTCAALVLASGSGDRFTYELPKQFCRIAGQCMLQWSLDLFHNHLAISEVVLVLHPEHIASLADHLMLEDYPGLTVIPGGKTRQASSYKGLAAVSNADLVLIHDAARPLTSVQTVDRVLAALKDHQAVAPCHQVSQTIYAVQENDLVDKVLNRDELKEVQTPQGFHLNLIRRAHEKAVQSGMYSFTDDCGLVLHFGLADVYCVPGESTNMKVTYPSDLLLAESLLSQTL